MEITKEEVALLEHFKKELSAYREMANNVFSVINNYDHMSTEDFDKLKKREREKRDELNERYGSIENLINKLLGDKPMMSIASVPGGRWDVFAEALSSRFTIVKGDCLSYAVDAAIKAYGKAKGLVARPATPNKIKPKEWFSDEVLSRISDSKIKKLCKELNQVVDDNPNSAALLMRTILLLTLQKKLGMLAKADLEPVLRQAISQDTYKDRHVKRILENLSSIPKTMLDATHHSKWVLIKAADLDLWLPGLVSVVEATFPLLEA